MPGAHVDDRGGPRLGPPASDPGEQRLVEAEGIDVPDPFGVVDQGGPVGDDGVVDGVPVAAQLPGQIADGPTPAADLFGHPPPGPVRHRQARCGDVRGGLGERPDLTVLRRADPAALVPHQPGRTPRSRAGGLDMDPHRTVWFVGRSQDGHVAEAHEKLADANRVNFHRGSRSWRRREPPESQGPCAAPGILNPRSVPPQIRRAGLRERRHDPVSPEASKTPTPATCTSTRTVPSDEEQVRSWVRQAAAQPGWAGF